MILRKINTKIAYPFIKEYNTFVIHTSRLNNKHIDSVATADLPIGITAKAISQCSNVLITDGENVKFLLNPNNQELTKEFIQSFADKMQKIQTHCAKIAEQTTVIKRTKTFSKEMIKMLNV